MSEYNEEQYCSKCLYFSLTKRDWGLCKLLEGLVQGNTGHFCEYFREIIRVPRVIEIRR